MRVERDYRSLPLWLAREYLVEIGGKAVSDVEVRGATWHARLSEGETIPIGALRIGQIRIIFDGDASTLDPLIAAFEKKALRAGG
jgi:hypothetical protein